MVDGTQHSVARSLPEAPAFAALTVFAAGALDGALAGIALPRGPVTTSDALALMVGAAMGGALAGWSTAASWTAASLPLGYIAGFELATLGSVGMTVDGLHLGSSWGLLAALTGRGLHGLVVLAPMMVGAALGAGARRRRLGWRPRHGRLAWARRGFVAVATVGLLGFAVALARPARVAPVVDAHGRAVPGGVAELVEVRLNGADQWLSIRGHDATLPVVLYLP